ncbi:TIP41-like protein [Morone saxatilis]|uniref:TIP41-like protein n=1 Tax=Morone saxatilis TaxID=34816 RepID=UPI0015E21DC1|nr:TIP41-like protein [Morone saxatilis]
MFASLSTMMSHGFKSSKQDFTFGPWKVTAAKNHIMKSKDIERLAEEMNMPSLPEMLFGDNVLRIQHTDGYGIEFSAINALKRVNNMEDAVKVACAQEWQESRQDELHSVFPKAAFINIGYVKQLWSTNQTLRATQKNHATLRAC